MSYNTGKESSPVSPLKKRRASWSELWVNHHHLLSSSPLDLAAKFQSLTPPISKSKTLLPDFTLLLPDLILIRVIQKIPNSQRKNLSLVCKRWFRLHGRLVRSFKVSDWEFLSSGRLISRFPNLETVDLVSGCLISPPNLGILVNHRIVSFTVGVGSYQSWSFFEENLLSVELVERGLKALAGGCSNLRKLVVTNTSELGLLNVAEECSRLQELELHKCSDSVLLGIGAFENLQILRLVGNVDGLYNSLVSDIGLMILAQGCKRLVKLELVGCEGGFDGIKEIGECCQMLEELTVCDNKMESGWLGGLRYCENLKTLKLVSCKKIDNDPDESLSCCCPALERLQLEKCQLRDKNTESEAVVSRRMLIANNIRSRIRDSTLARARTSESSFMQEHKRFRSLSFAVSSVLSISRIAVETRHQIPSLFKPYRDRNWGKRWEIFQENMNT
ncbi:unnamed protein product [Arabidopsis thaliana]|nr:unnamed protein product [Arabidopsis thaliana]